MQVLEEEGNIMAEGNFKAVGKTKGNKQIGYRTKQGTGLYEICFSSGGEIHESIKGLFKSPRDCQIAITNYLTNYQKTTKDKTDKKVA
jgi:hypothetical protein